MKTAKIIIDDSEYEFPLIEGTEQERAIDISELRAKTGCITLDNGYQNTGACASSITYIDGDKGILRYRGFDIIELAEKLSFVETAYLLIYGSLPTIDQKNCFFTPFDRKLNAARGHDSLFRGHAPACASHGNFMFNG